MSDTPQDPTLAAINELRLTINELRLAMGTGFAQQRREIRRILNNHQRQILLEIRSLRRPS